MTSSFASADRVAAAALALGVVLGLAAPARAQSGDPSRTGFAVSRFEPAERGSPYFVVDPLDLRSGTHPAVGASFDYAHKPLVVEDASGRERFALVRDQLFVHAGAAVALGSRVRLGIDLPFAASSPARR